MVSTRKRTPTANLRKQNLSTFELVIRKILEYCVIFMVGGIVYIGCEVIYRGHTHWSMFILGGLCLIIIGLLNEKPFFPESFGIIPQALLGAVIITVLEFVTGLIVNVWLGLGIWDYSNMPLNIMGQICLPFTLLWVILAAVAIVIDDYIRYSLFDEPFPTYTWWSSTS